MTDDAERKRIELDGKIQEYAKAEADRTYLHEFRKSKKAILMKQAEQSGHHSAVSQEREAYAHPEYIALLAGLRDATEIAVRNKWQLEALRMQIEVWRTRQATARAEMNIR